MTDSRIPAADRTLLILGGGFTVAMASFHFFLPTVFGWASEVKSVHPTVTWALFSLNFFFSSLLLLLGVVTLAGVFARRTHEWTYRAVLGSGAIFWLLNGGYQLIAPMPMPHRLIALSYFLRSYAFAVALFHLLPLARLGRRERASAAPTPSTWARSQRKVERR